MPDATNSGLKWNEHDRSFSITVKLKPEDGKGRRQKKVIKVEEPNVGELGEVQSLLDAAEEAAPPVDGIDTTAEDRNAEVRRVNQDLTDRAQQLYVTDKPYAEAVVKVIELLSDGSYIPDRDDLPGFCSSPVGLQTMVNKWRDPSPG